MLLFNSTKISILFGIADFSSDFFQQKKKKVNTGHFIPTEPLAELSEL